MSKINVGDVGLGLIIYCHVFLFLSSSFISRSFAKMLKSLLWKDVMNGIQVRKARFEFHSIRKMAMASLSWRCMLANRVRLISTTPPLQQAEAEQSEDRGKEQLSENDRVNPHFINRNPRNLEMMAVARKDMGWAQSHPRKDYWHKLIVTKSNRHITAHIEHIKGNMVVQASTKEWAIKQHLYSTSDVSASENIGRVLAERCLESGINFVHVNMEKTAQEQEGMAAFLGALVEGGLVLSEPRSIMDFNEPVDYFPEVD